MDNDLYASPREGAHWLGDTRVSLDSIVYEFLNGQTPESIAESFPVLSLGVPLEGEEEDVATQHQKSHSEAKLDDDLRIRNARALQLVREWLADESGYDEEVFPVLKAELEADRLSYRRRFKE